MTPENFCYWLQGWFELNETIDHREGATPETIATIKNHLNLVFFHSIDPQTYGEDGGASQDIHDGVKTADQLRDEWLEEQANKSAKRHSAGHDLSRQELSDKITEEGRKAVEEYMSKHPGLRRLEEEHRKLTC
jgi:hypothetical protein